MENRANTIALIAVASLLLTSCEAIEGIFKAGMGFGIFIVVIALAALIFIFTRFTKKD